MENFDFDGIYKIRNGNNEERLINVRNTTFGKFFVEVSPDKNTITYSQLPSGAKGGYSVYCGSHGQMIIWFPPNIEGWVKRYTKEDGKQIVFMRV